MRLNLGVFGFLLMRSRSSRAAWLLTCDCLYTRTTVHAHNLHTWRNTNYFDCGKNTKTPKMSPMPGLGWPKVWYPWYISVVLTNKIMLELERVSWYLKWFCYCWDSPHRHWNRIHQIWIPDSDSMWSCVSPTWPQITHFALLGWILTHCPGGRRTVTQHTMQFGSRLRLCGGKVVFGFGSPSCIGSGSKVPCGEPCC